MKKRKREEKGHFFPLIRCGLERLEGMKRGVGRYQRGNGEGERERERERGEKRGNGREKGSKEYR